MRQEHKFTLTELVIVVTVLALLLGIIIPGRILHAGEAGASIHCLNNFKKTGIFIKSYAADNNDFFPNMLKDISIDDQLGGGYDGRNLSLVEKKLVRITLDKVELKSELYLCPSAFKDADNNGWFRTAIVNASVSANSKINANLAGMINFDQSAKYPSQQMSKLNFTDKLIMMTERSSLPNYQGATSSGFVRGPADQGKTLHGNKMSYLFADGHVEELEPAKTVQNNNLVKPGGLWSNFKEDR